MIGFFVVGFAVVGEGVGNFVGCAVWTGVPVGLEDVLGGIVGLEVDSTMGEGCGLELVGFGLELVGFGFDVVGEREALY